MQWIKACSLERVECRSTGLSLGPLPRPAEVASCTELRGLELCWEELPTTFCQVHEEDLSRHGEVTAACQALCQGHSSCSQWHCCERGCILGSAWHGCSISLMSLKTWERQQLQHLCYSQGLCMCVVRRQHLRDHSSGNSTFRPGHLMPLICSELPSCWR